MEALCALCCALVAWVAVFVLAGVREGTPHAPAGRLLVRRVQAACVRVVDRLSTGGFVARLLELTALAHACEELSLSARAKTPVLLTRERACVCLLAALLAACVLCSLLTWSPVGVFAVLMGACVGVPVWDSSRRRALEQELAAEMPDVFRTMAMAMASGETLAQAVEYVGINERGPAGRAFERASLRMRCGMSAESALEALVDELDAPGVGLLATALLISQRTGSPLRGLFESSASLVERTREFERMLYVKTAQVRLSVRIVCLLPVLMLVGLSLLSPDFRGGLMTVPGVLSVVIAAALDLMALAIIRAILRAVL